MGSHNPPASLSSCLAHHSKCTQTVLRLGPTARIASWVDIYMLSALVKVRHVRRALYRYQLLVGSIAPYVRGPRHASTHAIGSSDGGRLVAGEWNERLAARHTGSGWLWDPLSKRAIRLNLHARALESHPSFFEAALSHRRAFQQLRNAFPPRAEGAGGALRAEDEDALIDDADEEWVSEILSQLQQPAGGCNNVRALVVELGRRDGRTGKIGSEIHGFGFGAQMHVLTIALAYAVRTQRILVMRSRDNWWYTDRTDCPSRAFTCYFQVPPLPRCPSCKR